jgi:hypothetical protein
MPDENKPADAAAAPQSMQVLVDERELRTMYSNSVRMYTTPEEVVIDFCFNMPQPNPQTGQQQLLLKVGERVIVNYLTAKRLAGSLTQLVKRYEQQFGELPTQMPAQAARK